MKAQFLLRTFAWLLVLAIIAFTLLPIEFRPSIGSSAKMERFLAFAVFVGVFCLAYPKYRISICMFAIAIIGLLELAQKFVPGRHGRLLTDGIPKVSGALFGFLIAMILRRYLDSVKEHFR
jgi:VanZ family protein